MNKWRTRRKAASEQQESIYENVHTKCGSKCPSYPFTYQDTLSFFGRINETKSVQEIESKFLRMNLDFKELTWANLPLSAVRLYYINRSHP